MSPVWTWSIQGSKHLPEAARVEDRNPERTRLRSTKTISENASYWAHTDLPLEPISQVLCLSPPKQRLNGIFSLVNFRDIQKAICLTIAFTKKKFERKQSTQPASGQWPKTLSPTSSGVQGSRRLNHVPTSPQVFWHTVAALVFSSHKDMSIFKFRCTHTHHTDNPSGLSTSPVFNNATSATSPLPFYWWRNWEGDCFGFQFKCVFSQERVPDSPLSEAKALVV